LCDLATECGLSDAGVADHDDAAGVGLPEKGRANRRELGVALHERPLVSTH
jgi:hypothetical protein